MNKTFKCNRDFKYLIKEGTGIEVFSNFGPDSEIVITNHGILQQDLFLMEEELIHETEQGFLNNEEEVFIFSYSEGFEIGVLGSDLYTSVSGKYHPNRSVQNTPENTPSETPVNKGF